ncbi:TIGR01548 family HAD-type hydrolase [filamentous cyanobacterium LEGE 11480]|uniref:TIGR01548 family HAD-type hydrolase n=1 Tax=Romeriopsis navalis LEGE 11480 TaxID=2777977 RepID=A0A928VT76_9CYAN|nr:TIGR01548 family HAD-type hydrolase [Romeriopsis navalis]MBE9033282.1 TIGR01548 family HAD-type hydrolase [Romeriopsis navalis LEGE 11480]
MIVLFDIDGVIRDVGGSYRRALADTVEHFTQGQFRPTPEEIDALKGEGCWNNDWEASQEFTYRYFEAQGQSRSDIPLPYTEIVDFFQSKYRGEQAQSDGSLQWTGYICDEPLLAEKAYFEQLTAAHVGWGFFSGATNGSATFVLQERLGLDNPLLIAMDDAPGKPDPAGMFLALERLGLPEEHPVIYVGDTVADMYTIVRARAVQPDRRWIAVGVLPPHVQDGGDRQTQYVEILKQAGAQIVLSNVQELTPELMATV